MPPLISSSSLSSLTRPAITSLPIRSFTTTTTLCAIGPENPRFIEIPQPPQQYAKSKRDIKGTLPPPREIFPPGSAYKTKKAYLDTVAPEPTADRHFRSASTDYITWKRHMAASRRDNLREGLLELHKRKRTQQDQMVARSKAKRVQHDVAVAAPIREDDRLSRPTVTQAVRYEQHGRVPDPGREERILQASERVRAQEAEQALQRRDALHTLYMHARDFITSEAQLNAEVERIFVEHPFGPEHPGRTNIWDAYGSPPTVQDMLATVNNSQKTAVEFHRGPGYITGKRMTRIAEELTGGKMD